MSKRRKIALFLVTAYAIGLAWGQVRLPYAAVKNMLDYPLLKNTPPVSASAGDLQMLGVQRWYISRSMNIKADTQPPRISVQVKWNAGIIARVDSGLYFGPEAAEGLDCLYVCLFGAWVPVYTFNHEMA